MRRLATEGLLREILPGVYLAACLSESPPLRAAAVGLLMPDRLVLAGAVVAEMAAAWVMVGGPPPEEIIVYLPAHGTRRGRLPIRVHETAVPAGDTQQLGPVRLTAAVRTAADVARRWPPEVAVPLLARLRDGAGVQPGAVLACLERMSRCRGVPHGREVVHRWSVELCSRAS